MIEDMTLAGLAPRTQEIYLQAVRRLAAYYKCSPELLSEEQVRGYVLHLRDQRGVARGTFKTNHGGIRFLFQRTLDRDWPLFSKKESGRPRSSVCPPYCRTPRSAHSLAV
jgi:integrase/recombinase XerD